MNLVVLIGRTTTDLELKETDNNRKYTQFTIAVDNGKDKEGNKRESDFINCVAWENNAEILSKFVKKGHKINIEGRFRTDKYTTENGENRYKSYVLVNRFEFLESKPKDNFTPNEPDLLESITENNTTEKDPYAEFGKKIELQDNDLPF